MENKESILTRASLKFIFSFDKEVCMEYARRGYIFIMENKESILTRASLKFIFSFDKEVCMEYARRGYKNRIYKEEFEWR